MGGNFRCIKGLSRERTLRRVETDTKSRSKTVIPVYGTRIFDRTKCPRQVPSVEKNHVLKETI